MSGSEHDRQLAALEEQLRELALPEREDAFRSELRARLEPADQPSPRQAPIRSRLRNLPRNHRSRPSRRSRPLLLTGSSLAAVAAITAVVLFAGTSPVRPADAALLARVVRALTGPAGTILHERAVSTANGKSVLFELWQSEESPSDYRVTKGSAEISSNGSTTESFDPSSGTIVRSADSTPASLSDPAAAIKAMIGAREARVVGAATIDGRPVWKLDAHNPADRFLTGTLYVDRTNYYPVLLEVAIGRLCANAVCTAVPEQIRFQTYEYLPATPANDRLLSLADQHPSVPVVTSDGTVLQSTGNKQRTRK